MKTILISGGKGRLAQHILNYQQNEYKIIPLSKQEMNICSRENIFDNLRIHRPQYLIHAAAITRPMALHDNNPQLSLRTNIIGTANIVAECMASNIKLIYISTDYVYKCTDGNYFEDSELLPPNKYGWSKLGGECAVRLYDNSLILRIAMITYPFPHKQAFSDVIKSCIYDKDIPPILFELLDEKGIINVGGPPISIHAFVQQDNKNIEAIQAPKEIPHYPYMNLSKLLEIEDQ